MEKEAYSVENIYEPGYSSFHPSKDQPSMNYKIRSGQMGMTTDPRTANQLAKVSEALSSGVIPIEMGVLNPETFDQIPEQHFSELRRKAKLAGAKISMHSPLVEPSGMTQQGWDERQRELSERQLKDIIDKAAMLEDKGNIPVTIHPANYQGSTWKFEGKGDKREKTYEQMVAIDRETGNLIPAKEEVRYYPGGEKGVKEYKLLEAGIAEKKYSPTDQLDALNGTKWDDMITKIEFQRESAQKILEKINPLFEGQFLDLKYTGKKDFSSLSQGEYEEYKKVVMAKTHITEAERDMRAAFSKAYKLAQEDGNKKEIEYLENLSKQYSEKLKYKDGKSNAVSQAPSVQSEAIFGMVQGLKALRPKLFLPVEDFATRKASETFANVATHAYSKYKDKAPILSIENLPAGMAFSQVKDQAKLIEESRKKFVEKATLSKKEGGLGLSRSKASQVAEKIIGATFDVGHMNINKKHGFTNKDIAKEAAEIAKFVKHVHLTDNFGYSDSHLPPGMGNVPFKEIMENLGKQGANARKINEVGGWFEHFKTNPFNKILQASGSEIYSSGESPYWSQSPGFQQSYMEGYGRMLPTTNYEMFGAGFANLPSDLGGSKMGGGERGRFASGA